MTTEPDIFDVIKHNNTFLAAAIFTAMGADPAVVSQVIAAKRSDGNHEVLLTINGVKLSAFAVFDWLEQGFDKCVAEKAEELLRERTGGRLDQATHLIEDFQRKLRDLIDAPVAASFIDVVFDGPPDHDAGRFVEVENADGKSINVGEWIDRGNGLWALRFYKVPT